MVKKITFVNNHQEEWPFKDNHSVRSDLLFTIISYYRLYRKTFNNSKKYYKIKNFKKILYVTYGDIPTEFVKAFQKQYPNMQIIILIPIFKIPINATKINIKAEFFAQNKKQEAQLYKYRTKDNISIYGIYCLSYNNIESNNYKFYFKDIQYILPFVKAARILAKKIKPDIIHSELIPFFLGYEVKKNKSYPIKVVQIFSDFNNNNKVEPFWAAINFLDKKSIKRLINDKIIKKYIAKLFNIQNTTSIANLNEYLDVIFDTYLKYSKNKYDKNDDYIFQYLNKRTIKLFPELFIKDCKYYDLNYYTIEKANKWCVYSRTYYNKIFCDNEFPQQFLNLLKKYSYKSDFLFYANNVNYDTDNIKFSLNVENFRENKILNKQYLIKEFSNNRINTKFYDKSLFKNDITAINGYLDSLYSAPLLFFTVEESSISEYDVDIVLHSILKLFEYNKNLQIIFNIPGYKDISQISSFIEFCLNANFLNGRWLFIDGALNLNQFYASSDVALLPDRVNPSDSRILKALNYGCIPVTSNNGIYNDIIEEILNDMTTGCGFKANMHYDNLQNDYLEFTNTLLKTLNFYNKNQSSWNLLIKNALKTNTKWSFDIIQKYNEIYTNI